MSHASIQNNIQIVKFLFSFNKHTHISISQIIVPRVSNWTDTFRANESAYVHPNQDNSDYMNHQEIPFSFTNNYSRFPNSIFLM